MLETWFKNCFKMIKELANNENMKNVYNVAKALRDAIEAFRVKFPFLAAFSSEAILQRHWDSLADRMGGKKPPEEDIMKINMQMLF